ncbi:MAG: YceI family protein [Chitinophagaceae bacterium]|nr:MAG: YceI family protein [Chitinophagaceae bacterium]
MKTMRIKSFLLITTIMFAATVAIAQDRYYTKTATISFFSKTDLEDIEAINKIVTAVIDTKSGAVQFSVPMKAFAFEKGLMQEHFNENYVESDKFPNGTFKGTITNNQNIRYNTPGSYDAIVSGNLTIHGVTRGINTKGKITVAPGSLNVNSLFDILLSDYNISVPALVADKISKTIKINIQGKLEPLNR